jgi:hypothetical protein
VARELVRVELAFVTDEDAEALGDRIREAVALIVGRERLEEFRVRRLPLEPPRPGPQRGPGAASSGV